MKTITITRRQEEDRRIITATEDLLVTEDRQDRGIPIMEDQITEDRIMEDRITIDIKNIKLFQERNLKQFFYIVRYNKKM